MLYEKTTSRWKKINSTFEKQQCEGFQEAQSVDNNLLYIQYVQTYTYTVEHLVHKFVYFNVSCFIF